MLWVFRTYLGDPRIQTALGVLLGINISSPDNMDVDPPMSRPDPRPTRKEEKMDTSPAQNLTPVNIKNLK